MWKSLCVLLSAGLLSLAAWGESTGDLGQYLKADHPDSYVVKKGDSLWKIAGKVYHNPLKWPRIYRANRDKISNPNKIYPSQVLTIPQD